MRRFTCSAALLLLFALPGSAQEAKPNTLTPKEIADGWILLFDGETTFGWRVAGDAKVENGSLILGGEKQTTASFTTQFAFYDFQMAFRAEGAVASALAWEWKGPGEAQTIGLSLGPAAKPADWGKASVRQTITANARFEAIMHIETPGLPDSRYALGQAEPGSWIPNTLTIGVPPKGKLALRNVKLKPLGTKPIFNEKDLTRWKEIKTERTKSVFAVTDKGELNIKNGPGDIQTEGQWDDFVLQLDIISNGKHLNSGVFFRALPGEFWSGYEAQIRNQWQGDDRTKPVDFGTGGIYNRQPARKVVSTDNEWLTMTVIANGKHIATWVNGYQVTDYTDDRPMDKSARKGSKIDKGPISLQGHDPTTDLSFRNIRIAELPKGK